MNSIEENAEEGNLDHSGVRLEPMPAVTIDTLKGQLRLALNDYRLAYPQDYPCGASMVAYLRPSLATKAKRVNALARELRALDPDFPGSWVDLPEGL